MNTENASHSSKVSTAVALLDRAWGKPEQRVKASIESENNLADVLREISERRQAEQASIPTPVAS